MISHPSERAARFFRLLLYGWILGYFCVLIGFVYLAWELPDWLFALVTLVTLLLLSFLPQAPIDIPD